MGTAGLGRWGFGDTEGGALSQGCRSSGADTGGTAVKDHTTACPVFSPHSGMRWGDLGPAARGGVVAKARTGTVVCEAGGTALSPPSRWCWL